MSPTTCSVSMWTKSMSAGDVPTSSAVMYLPARDSTARPWARKIISRSRVFGIADDDGLPSTQVQPGQRRLVGHPTGKAEGVLDGLPVGLIVPEPGAAQGRTQGGVVDGNDPFVPDAGLVPEHELLVLPLALILSKISMRPSSRS